MDRPPRYTTGNRARRATCRFGHPISERYAHRWCAQCKQDARKRREAAKSLRDTCWIQLASYLMSDARPTVHTDALDTLGSIIGPEEKRDAIHLAVYPIEAGEVLQPGQHVFLLDDDGLAYRALPGKGLGIVDPFLTKPVQADERFWLVVYPREINSLRHVWEHAGFPSSGEAPELLVPPTPKRGESLLWLEQFAKDANIDLGSLLRSAKENRHRGEEYLTIYGDDASGDIPDEFWHHFEIYSEETIPKSERASYFSCSC